VVNAFRESGDGVSVRQFDPLANPTRVST